ncbi:hypothetical protein COU80_02285 [Candidatus Peregrinibacteria bacterium CG10_big_fil_rev_8_21_14_0_10_55_24]|nr:MAG: hypothetical protein COU80_02285 [Candidatus Peregrinibacteria bacterium CG10_big_fil_rev_8_21_14_0_10_55_24]
MSLNTPDRFDPPPSLNGKPIALPLVEAIAEVYSRAGRTLRIAGREVPTFREAAMRVQRLSELARSGLAIQVEDVLGESGSSHYTVTDLDTRLLSGIE